MPFSQLSGRYLRGDGLFFCIIFLDTGKNRAKISTSKFRTEKGAQKIMAGKTNELIKPSLEVSVLSTEELERVASHLRAHDELFKLDAHDRADLDAVLAELDQRGCL